MLTCISVKRPESDPAPGRVVGRLLGLLLAGIFFAATALAAPEPAPKAEGIHVTADRMVAESSQRSAEFIGNVRAVQGTTVITADRLKVFYRAESAQETQADPAETEAGAIEKLHCTGQVVIHFDDKVAVCDEAVYTAENAILVLTGPEASVTSGKNSVTGEKITVFRNEDRMLVESGSHRRVEAVFFPKGKGLK